ncbi:MAG: primosomal protein N' [Myxococcales bacterium]|nr:primosomal protein N' [Myxococcales bacterium]
MKVAVARPLGGELTYAVPAPLGELSLGHVVMVPLGSQGETAYVVDRLDAPDYDPAKIKPISRVLDPIPAFDAEQLAFLRWVADYYLAPLGMVIHTALPSGIRAKTLRALMATDEGVVRLTRREVAGEDLQVLREAIARPGLTRRGLTRRLAEELDKKAVDRAVQRLVRAGLCEWQEREVGGSRATVRTVTRTDAPAEGRLGKRMQAILGTLDQSSPKDLADLVEEHGSATRDAVARLEERGLVELGEREKRDVLMDAPPLGAAEPPDLNEDQRAALEALCREDARGAYLLFGVTGSGKTEVFLGAAQAVLDRGQQVVVLVPEIGLTPQLVGRFRARFGDRVAVLHSGLTGAARLAQWRRIRAGDVDVAVGARSALFAPFRDLGLLVVDEEHDDSYKQDEGVPYSARDLAVVLAHRRECPVVLASATPSLESWFNAQQGRYRLLRLPKRATPRPVPRVELVDLTEMEVPEGSQRPLLAPVVEHALRATFARGGQAIVLYNRRGYATQVECTSCGATYECPNCAITMTLHKGSGRMACHYCGLKLRYTTTCPVCQAPDMHEAGKGTERIEERLQELFPSIAIGRMDADTTRGRGSHLRILSAFREGDTQLLVGTQIVAKGHDFPGVQTAVVISADRGFRMPDFRAAERTAALLIQLAGRAGRGDVPGQVFVQTYKPDHYALQHLDDLVGFYDVELRLRATLRYPPFSRLCLVRVDGVDRRTVQAKAEELGRKLRQAGHAHAGVTILGPAPAAMPRLVGRWRFQIIARGESTGPLRAFLRQARTHLERRGGRGVRVSWDIDPRHLM